jgi:hypothetical protein
MPPPTQVPAQKIEPSKTQATIDITDDHDDIDKKVNANHFQQTKPKALGKFIAQRPIAMPSPTQISSRKIKPSQTQVIIDITDDDDDDFMESTPSFSYQSRKKLKPK